MAVSIGKDIKNLEKVRKCASKFILYYTSDYKNRLFSVLLPVCMWLELQGVLFLVKCLKDPLDNFDILKYVSFSSNITKSTTRKKLVCNYKRTNTGRHFYFNRIVRLWKSFPEIDFDQSIPTIKAHLSKFLWNHFVNNSHSPSPALTTSALIYFCNLFTFT